MVHQLAIDWVTDKPTFTASTCAAHQKVLSYVQINFSTLFKVVGVLIGLGVLLLAAPFLPEILGIIVPAIIGSIV